jgi:uridylate kinase
MSNEIIIISVGGSLICPDNIDIAFLKKLKEIIIGQIKKGKRFVLITGGGKTARNYQFAAREVGLLDNEDLDWLGIHATRINAHLVRTIFKEYAHPQIIMHPAEKIDFKEKILVAAGWKPGFSTDYDAVLLAKQFKVKKIINLSNIFYVYDKDPAKYGDAKPYKTLSWKDYRKMFGEKWNPGLSSPFDPVASKEAEKLKMKVYIINGADMDNLYNLLEGKNFVGTIIS